MNEQQNIEFKSQWADNILKTVCAFADTCLYRAVESNEIEAKGSKKFRKYFIDKSKEQKT